MSARAQTASVLLASLLAISASCSGEAPGGNSKKLTLYTSVTQDTVNAVVSAYESAHPDTQVNVFRAPTGKLNARIAADRRSGQVGADVVWATDPLSTQRYVEQGLLRRWQLDGVSNIPDAFKTDYFWGTRVLYLILVTRENLQPRPQRWTDLADAAYRGEVALPDPAFAGSAFAALGYFAQERGTDFYRKLRAKGAVEVASIPQVATDVAQGRYELGITLARIARDARQKGSPIDIVWPQPGAIAVYSPIGIFKATEQAAVAQSFVRFVLSPDAQRKIADTGWEPARSDVSGPEKPSDAQWVTPNWSRLFGRQQELLREYEAIFGG